MRIDKLKPWFGVVIALLPAVKLAGQILGFPLLDYSHVVDILIAAAGGAGVSIVAKSEPVGKK